MPKREVVTDPPMSLEKLEALANPLGKEDWMLLVEEAKRIVRVGEENVWDKGDIAHEAADRYGRLKELCDEVGESYAYWRVLSSIATKYSKEDRKAFPSLTFAHYKIAAPMEDRLKWLQRAADEGWNTLQLSAEIRRSKKPEEKVAPAEPEGEGTPTTPTQATQVIPELTPKRQISEAVELLNMMAERDSEVAKGIGLGRRGCSAALLDFFEEAFEEEEMEGISVLDIINLIFLDQGRIIFNNEDIKFVVA